MNEIWDKLDGTIFRSAESLGVLPGDFAIYSPCKRYRYVLTRNWQPTGDLVAFIGMNPSTATESDPDNTVTRCIRYAKGWGFAGMFMLNSFAYRSTDRSVLKGLDDPIGEANDKYILRAVEKAAKVVCVWGVDGGARGRQEQLAKMLQGVDLHCLAVTNGGFPQHPLYLRRDLLPIPWRAGPVEAFPKRTRKKV